ARVHGLGARALDHLEQLVHVEIGLGRRPRAEQIRLRGALDVLRVAVGLGVDRHRLDPELVERADDTNGDLASVADQDLCEQAGAPSYPPAYSWSATASRPTTPKPGSRARPIHRYPKRGA